MNQTPPLPEYLTLSEICRALHGKVARPDRARLAYVVECLGLVPARTVGTVRLWHRDALPAIQAAAARIASRSKGVGRG